MSEDYSEIDGELRKMGYKPIDTCRKTRKIELVYHGAVLSKKNRHIVSKQGSIIPDKKARANENDIICQFTDQLKKMKIVDAFVMTKQEQIMRAQSHDARYKLAFLVYRANEIRRDLDNQLNTLLDALVASFAIPDDSCKFVKQIIIADKGVDKQNPRVEVEITISEET